MNPTMTAHTDTAERNPPLTVDLLVSESLQIMLIEGHVDLTAAQRAMDAEGSEGFSSAEHTWMRYATCRLARMPTRGGSIARKATMAPNP